MTAPKLGVVILNWNGIDETILCLKSLLPVAPIGSEIIVVDNGSREDECTPIRESFPMVTVLSLPENLGFGQGVMAGAALARSRGAEQLLMLNNDARLPQDDDTIGKLQEAIQQRNVGAVAPIVLEDKPPHLIQSAGHMFSIWTGYPRRLMTGKPNTSEIRVIEPTFIVAACLLVSMEAFYAVGGFDPEFFVYSEDFDFGLRLAKGGYRELLVPDAKIYHKKATATKLWSEMHSYLMIRSHLIFVRKHARWYHWFSLAPCTLGISFIMALLGFSSFGLSAVRGVLRGYVDFFKGSWGPPITHQSDPRES